MREKSLEGFEFERGLQGSEADCRELKGQSGLRHVGENVPGLAPKHPGLGPQGIHHPLTCQKEAQQGYSREQESDGTDLSKKTGGRLRPRDPSELHSPAPGS